MRPNIVHQIMHTIFLFRAQPLFIKTERVTVKHFSVKIVLKQVTHLSLNESPILLANTSIILETSLLELSQGF